MPVQLKDVLHFEGYTVWDLYDKMQLRGHKISYNRLTAYCRCYKRDKKSKWDQIKACLKEDFEIEIPWL